MWPRQFNCMEETRRSLCAGVGVALLGGAFSQTARAQEVTHITEEVNRSASTSGVSAFTIDNEVGDVTVTAEDRSDVDVTAVKRAQSQSAVDSLSVDLQKVDGTLELVGDIPSDVSNASVEFDVRVPSELPTSSVSTFVGDITVDGVAGYVDVSNETGSLTVSGTDGLSNATTNTGDIDVEVSAIDSDTSVESSTGTVEAALATGLDADVTAETTLGGVSVGSLPLNVSSGFLGETASGTLGSGTHEFSVSTDTGDIELTEL